MGMNVKNCSDLGIYGFSVVCDLCGIDTVSFDSQEDLNMYLTNTRWHATFNGRMYCAHCIDALISVAHNEKPSSIKMIESLLMQYNVYSKSQSFSENRTSLGLVAIEFIEAIEREIKKEEEN